VKWGRLIACKIVVQPNNRAGAQAANSEERAAVTEAARDKESGTVSEATRGKYS